MEVKQFPAFSGNELVAEGCSGMIRCFAGFNEVKGSLETKCGVGERDSVGPGNAFGGVGCGGGWELDTFMVVNNAVVSGGVMMPEWPPSPVVVWESFVGGGGGKEMATAGSGCNFLLV